MNDRIPNRADIIPIGGVETTKQRQEVRCGGIFGIHGYTKNLFHLWRKEGNFPTPGLARQNTPAMGDYLRRVRRLRDSISRHRVTIGGDSKGEYLRSRVSISRIYLWFSQPTALGTLALHGDQLVNSPKGLRPSLFALQEIGIRKMKHQLHFAHTHPHWIPGQIPWISNTLAVWVGALYSGGAPKNPRTRGIPYQKRNNAASR